MDNQTLSPEEYELHLKDLSERLEVFLERGEGDAGRLLKLAEELLGMSEAFPAVYEKYRRIEGLAGDMLAKRTQQQFMKGDSAAGARRGCLIGWLFGER